MRATSAVIQHFAVDRYGLGARVQLTPLRGGLEAAGIARAVVRRDDAPVGSFVAKPFSGRGRRELYVYRLLDGRAQSSLAPALLGWRYTDRHRTAGYIFLEWVPSRQRWPWGDVNSCGVVVDRLAALHRMQYPELPSALAKTWDYDVELIASAQSTLDFYGRAFLTGVRPGGRAMLPALRRILASLRRLRHELMSFSGTTLLHGDAHPGNVVMRGGGALLLDWGRARIGSPLEDLSSWVHTVGFWEPEAKRRHDTLLHRFLQARGTSTALSREFRDALILAGASNALAGALRYHLAVVIDTSQPPIEQFNSFRAASDWLRILRRADAVMRR
jgi:hypothetical protein